MNKLAYIKGYMEKEADALFKMLTQNLQKPGAKLYPLWMRDPKYYRLVKGLEQKIVMGQINKPKWNVVKNLTEQKAKAGGWI